MSPNIFLRTYRHICSLGPLQTAGMQLFTVTSLEDLSVTVARLEASGVNGARLTLDVPKQYLCASPSDTLRLSFDHQLSYACNVAVISREAGCLVASAGGLLLVLHGGDPPGVADELQISVEVVLPKERVAKRPRTDGVPTNWQIGLPRSTSV